MPTIGEPPPGRLPRNGDKVHVATSNVLGLVYVVVAPGTVQRGLNVWSVRVRPRDGITESWALLSNVTVIKEE